MAQAFSVTVRDLSDVIDVVLPDALETVEAFRVHQAWRVHGAWLTAYPGAVASLARLAARLDDALGDGVLLLPSASSSAPRVWDGPERVGAVRAATLRLTCAAGITGRPAVSAPLLHVDAPPSGPEPVGLCLVGPRGSDVALVRLAAQMASRISHSSG